MAKFCGKCGNRLDEATGLCPNCEFVQMREIYRLQSLEEQMNSAQNSNNMYTYASVNAQKPTRKEKKADKKANKTTGQKIRGFFLMLLISILILAIIISSAACALVYFNVIDIPFVSSVLNVLGIENENTDEILPTETSVISTDPNAQIAVIGGVIYSNESKNTTIKNATIVFVKQGETEPCKTVRSDDDGNFEAALESGVYTITVSCEGYEDYTEEITVEGESSLELNDINLLSVFNTSGEFLSDDILVKYEDLVVYADQEGIWVVDETSNDSKLLNKCQAKNVATNGKVIYYSVYNSEVSGKSSQIGETTWYQYDLYSINIDGTNNKKIMSFNECGEPKCVIDNVLYFTDYPDDFDGNMVGLAQSLFAYDLKSNKKTKISDGAGLVFSYKEKIYFRDIIVSTDITDRAQIYCYDTQNNKIDKFTDEGAVDFNIKNGKLIYRTVIYSSNVVDYNVYICDLDSGTKEMVFDSSLPSSSAVQYADDKYIYSIVENDDKYEYYRKDVATGEETRLTANDAAIENMRLQVVKGDNCAYYNALQNGAIAVLKLEDDSDTIEFINYGDYIGEELIGIYDDGVYVRTGNNFYFYSVERYSLNN